VICWKKSSNRKIKTVDGEELLPKLTAYLRFNRKLNENQLTIND